MVRDPGAAAAAVVRRSDGEPVRLVGFSAVHAHDLTLLMHAEPDGVAAAVPVGARYALVRSWLREPVYVHRAVASASFGAIGHIGLTRPGSWWGDGSAFAGRDELLVSALRSASLLSDAVPRRVAGLVEQRGPAGPLEVSRFFVASSWRGCRVGSALLADAQAFAAAQGRGVVARVPAGSSTGAGFFRAVGFTEVGAAPDGSVVFSS